MGHMRLSCLLLPTLLCILETRAQWVQTSGPEGGVVSALAVSGPNVFAGTEEGGVFLSTNSGKSWTPANTGLTNRNVRSFAASGLNLFAGTDNGVFLSTNSGVSWTAVGAGLTSTGVLSLALRFSGLP